MALKQVEFWDEEEIVRLLAVHEMEARREAKEDFKKWVLLKEISWRRKSMEVWLKEGDRNTSFFHKMANAHRRRNSMARVKINGTWLTEGNEIRDEVVNVFKVQLSTAGNWSPTLVAFPFARLEALEAARLEEPFFEEEVFEALKSFSGDKAPGPDGFSIAFWQFSWGFVKKEVMDFFREFYDHNSFVRSLNATFLVLIPKKGRAEDYTYKMKRLRMFHRVALTFGYISFLELQ